MTVFVLSLVLLFVSCLFVVVLLTDIIDLLVYRGRVWMRLYLARRSSYWRRVHRAG